MTSLRRKTLTSQDIIELLGDRTFYVRCLAFFPLREACLARRMAYLTAVAARDPAEQRIIQPAIEAFVRNAAALAEEDRDLLLPLGDYLASQLGRDTNEFRICYQKQGKVVTLSIPVPPDTQGS